MTASHLTFCYAEGQSFLMVLAIWFGLEWKYAMLVVVIMGPLIGLVQGCRCSLFEPVVIWEDVAKAMVKPAIYCASFNAMLAGLGLIDRPGNLFLRLILWVIVGAVYGCIGVLL